MRLIKNFFSLLGFLSLPAEERKLIFYSEGATYWPHLEGIIKALLCVGKCQVVYITSDFNDPAFLIDDKNLKVFTTDEGFLRNWLFENIEAEVMVMTMPDIGQYQLKCSKHSVHYVYVQHSLVSFHMVYREGAFDYYDTIFCSAPHHLIEMKALEKQRKLKPKNLIEVGYSRLDSILAQNGELSLSEDLHVLLAPSWGEASITNNICHEIISKLLEANVKVTYRPHPMSVKHELNVVEKIVSEYKGSDYFVYEGDVTGKQSLLDSHVMISDWSGVALEYAFGLNKPVLFIDVPRKVNNLSYEELGITPFEVNIREKVGEVLDPDDVSTVVESIKKLSVLNLNERQHFAKLGEIYNVGCSDEVAANYLLGMLF